MKKDHLAAEDVDHVTSGLWKLEGILKGLAALFQQQGGEVHFNADALFGIGQLLLGLSQELSVLKDTLNANKARD